MITIQRFLFFLAMLFAALAARAQSAAEAPASSARVIEEVIVSATKREQSVRDVPISIDAFTGDRLGELGASNMEAIVQYSPGVALQKGEAADNNRVTIRGIGGNSFFTNRTFGVFVDDVSLVNPSVLGIVPDIDPFDMASVEVLKGPQGTLFGGSALAGAVRYVPARPDFDGIYGSVSFGGGVVEDSDERLEQYTAMLNLGGGDLVALRLAGSVRKYPGYIDDLRFAKEEDINGIDIDTARAMLDWRLGEYFTVQLTHIERDAETEQFGYVDNLENRRDLRSKTADENGSSELKLSYATLKLSYFEAFDVDLILAWLDKSSVQSYDYTHNFSLQGSGTRARIDKGETATEQPSVELRVASARPTDSRFWVLRDWQYLIGAYKQVSEQFNSFPTYIAEPDPNASEDEGAIVVLPGLTTGVFIYGEVYGDAEEVAAYFDVTRDLFSGRVQLGLGGRFYKQTTDFYNTNDMSLILADGLLTSPQPLGGTNAVLKEDGFTPKASLTWFVTDDLQLYTSAVKGFRYGGGNYTLPEIITGEIPPTFDSDELWNYEAGVRSEWLQRTLQVDVAIYQIDWDDTQVNQLSSGSVLDFNYIDNIGSARSRGAELKVHAELPYGFSALLNAGYVEAEVTEDFESPRGSVEAGTTMPAAPKWTSSVVLAHRAGWRDWWLETALSLSYRGESKHDYIRPIVMEAHHSFGLSLNMGNDRLPGRPQLSLTATNLTDESAILGTYNASTGMEPQTGEVKAVLLSPRTIVANLAFHF